MKSSKTTSRTLAIIIMAVVSYMPMQAQVPYPKSFFEDSYFEQMKLKGKAPGIGDFATHFFESDAMPEIWGLAYDAWKHYQKHEPQTKGTSFVYDAKNGYMRFDVNYREAYGDDIENEEVSCIEMCFWNCADRKHKLFAINCKSMTDGRYYEAQYEGLVFQIYDNATRKLYVVSAADLGAEINVGTDENYSMKDGEYFVTDRETGKPKKLNEEEFNKWYDERPVIVYSLPQQGKDITVLIQRGAKKQTKHLRWDGMRFSLKD